MDSELRLQRASMDLPEAVALMCALDAESQARYPFDLSKHFVVDAAEVSGERGSFLLAYLDDLAVGCGAVRLLRDRDAELKRMYVAPEARGRGVASALLRELEAEAARLGARRLILETGNKQIEALALYRREGYAEIPRYEPYVDAQHSICMEKNLT